jgi:hypothetical protein
MNNLQQLVAEQILSAGETVKSTVVTKLADIEINSRVSKITDTISKMESFAKELKKINRNDIITYASGTPSESMSKNRFDEIEKLKGKVEQLNNLFDSALNDNTSESYLKLTEFLIKLNGKDNSTTDTFASN